MTSVFSGPEESTSAMINGLDDSFWDIYGRHVVKGNGAEDSSREGEVTCSVKKGGTPTGEVFVAGRNKGKTIMDRNFGVSQRKPKVRLGK